MTHILIYLAVMCLYYALKGPRYNLQFSIATWLVVIALAYWGLTNG